MAEVNLDTLPQEFEDLLAKAKAAITRYDAQEAQRLTGLMNVMQENLQAYHLEKKAQGDALLAKSQLLDDQIAEIKRQFTLLEQQRQHIMEEGAPIAQNLAEVQEQLNRIQQTYLKMGESMNGFESWIAAFEQKQMINPRNAFFTMYRPPDQQNKE